MSLVALEVSPCLQRSQRWPRPGWSPWCWGPALLWRPHRCPCSPAPPPGPAGGNTACLGRFRGWRLTGHRITGRTSKQDKLKCLQGCQNDDKSVFTQVCFDWITRLVLDKVAQNAPHPIVDHDKVRSHQVECSQHDVEGVHLWSDQLLSVHLNLHTVAEQLQQHLDTNTQTHAWRWNRGSGSGNMSSRQEISIAGLDCNAYASSKLQCFEPIFIECRQRCQHVLDVGFINLQYPLWESRIIQLIIN